MTTLISEEAKINKKFQVFEKNKLKNSEFAKKIVSALTNILLTLKNFFSKFLDTWSIHRQKYTYLMAKL